MGKKQLVVEFVGGAGSDTEESGEVTVSLPTAPLAEIGRDRKSGLAQMSSQTESLVYLRSGDHQ
jgi:hypothetical protein